LELYGASGLELQTPKKGTFKAAYNRLKKALGENRYIQRLYVDQEHINDKESLDKFINARTLYEQMIKQDLTDYNTRKRTLALFKLDGDLDQFIFHLNGFLEGNPNDTEGWQ